VTTRLPPRPPGRPSKLITSVANPVVLETRRLERERKERERQGVYLAWGLHLAGDALSAGAGIARALISPDDMAGPEAIDLMSRFAAGGTPIMQVTSKVLDAIAMGAGDQGVLLVIRRPADTLDTVIASGTTLVLAAHGVQDPGNLGSMARSALACGAGALVALEGCADPFASKVVRAAMGAHVRLPVLLGKTAPALAALRRGGFFIVAAAPNDGSRPDAVDLSRKSVLLLGGEGSGLPASILEAASERVRIPMTPVASSLNVGAAAAILLYEAQRQRGFPIGR
jgi:TrmH family RNA methyltransferase